MAHACLYRDCKGVRQWQRDQSRGVGGVMNGVLESRSVCQW